MSSDPFSVKTRCFPITGATDSGESWPNLYVIQELGEALFRVIQEKANPAMP